MLNFEGFGIGEAADTRLQIHERLLRKWNPSAGLVGPAALQNLLPHYVDSIEISRLAASLTEDGVVDLGSGGGFPGIVFAALYPDRFVRLVERDSRKRSFLKTAALEMGLPRVHVESEFEKGYDGVLLARAVMPPEKLLKFLRPRLLHGGRVLVCLGSKEALPELGPDYSVGTYKKYLLPGDAGMRQVHIVSRETLPK